MARELDRLELFGITAERVSTRYGLSVAYIPLAGLTSLLDVIVLHDQRFAIGPAEVQRKLRCRELALTPTQGDAARIP